MSFEVYDYRTDLRNVVITPEIRSRFLKFEPGTGGSRHSHDLGHEVFLVLEGQAEFEIDGDKQILGPGQMCVAYADQMHEVRCVGDQPITMYLSVTPHLEPTHTQWDAAGNKLAPRYGGSTRQERAGQPKPTDPVEEVVDRHVAAAETLAEVAVANAKAQEAGAVALKQALAASDAAGAKAAVDAMWAKVYLAYKCLQAMELAWNELAPRATETP